MCINNPLPFVHITQIWFLVIEVENSPVRFDITRFEDLNVAVNLFLFRMQNAHHNIQSIKANFFTNMTTLDRPSTLVLIDNALLKVSIEIVQMRFTKLIPTQDRQSESSLMTRFMRPFPSPPPFSKAIHGDLWKQNSAFDCRTKPFRLVKWVTKKKNLC